MLGSKHSPTSSYHPQTDGQAERMIGSLHNILAKLTSSSPKNWDIHIPFALFAYCTSVHKMTCETPFFLMHGCDPLSPSDLQMKQWMGRQKKVLEFSCEVIEWLKEAQKRVKTATQRQKRRSEDYYNQG